MDRILIVKTSAIGDVLQTLPVVNSLRRRYPKAQIDWVVEKPIASLLKAHPQLTRVLVVDTKSWRKQPWKKRGEIKAFLRELREVEYDMLYDLQGNTKSAFITGAARAKEKVGYSWTSLPEKPNWFVTTRRVPVSKALDVRRRYLTLIGEEKEDCDSVNFRLSPSEEERLFATGSRDKKRRFMICFGSNWRNKTLSEKQLQEFLQRIEERYHPHFFIIYGNPAEKAIAQRLNGELVGDLSLPLWQQLMARVDLVIAMDSAALHLCATTDTPSFSFFGPSSMAAYKPNGEKHASFQGSCPYGIEFTSRCPKLRTCETGACLRDISSELLFAAFEKEADRLLGLNKNRLITL